MLQSATILGFSRAVRQPIFDRLICFGFWLLYLAGMGALVVTALCTDAVRNTVLLFVAMPSGIFSVLVLAGSRFLRIAEQQQIDKGASPKVSDSLIEKVVAPVRVS